MLTERQKIMLNAALSYATANLDDLNDALATEYDQEDEPLDDFKLLIGGQLYDQFEDGEMGELVSILERMG